MSRGWETTSLSLTFLTCRKEELAPAKAKGRIGGRETLPGFCDADKGTAVMSWFLELSPKSGLLLWVSSPGSAQPVSAWSPPGLFTPHWPLAACVSRGAAWLSGLTRKAPASGSILGLTWMNLSLEGRGGDSATQTAVWTPHRTAHH